MQLHSSLTPSLKRPLSEHRPLSRDPFQSKLTLTSSRHKVTTHSLHSFSENDNRIELKEKDDSFLSGQTQNTEDASNVGEEEFVKIQEKIDNFIDEDFKLSIRAKDKKSYIHRYQYKEESPKIWISQPKWIPKEVTKAYEKAESMLEGSEKVNFMQGYLSEIGFMYYAIE